MDKVKVIFSDDSIKEYLKDTTLGFDYRVYLSTRPEKYIGSENIWEMATDSLEKVLNDKGLNYDVDTGGGVFYGPKIDIKLVDALGREWQGPTYSGGFQFT